MQVFMVMLRDKVVGIFVAFSYAAGKRTILLWLAWLNENRGGSVSWS
jgi:hypothetical protein